MRSPINWIGGKSASATAIIARMPPHLCYCEPFAGAAWVFFKKEPAKCEVLNDVNEDLMTFYREVKLRPMALVRKLESMPHSRVIFRTLVAGRRVKCRRLDQAARFAYLLKSGFGGKMVCPSFGYGKTRRSPGVPTVWHTLLTDAAARLANATLECGQWRDIVRRYDGPRTLFYCDPPYWNMPYYTHSFIEADHDELAARLRKVQGKFLLSYNDVPEVRQRFKWARITRLEIPYCLHQATRGIELLISNF